MKHDSHSWSTLPRARDSVLRSARDRIHDPLVDKRHDPTPRSKKGECYQVFHDPKDQDLMTFVHNRHIDHFSIKQRTSPRSSGSVPRVFTNRLQISPAPYLAFLGSFGNSKCCYHHYCSSIIYNHKHLEIIEWVTIVRLILRGFIDCTYIQSYNQSHIKWT